MARPYSPHLRTALVFTGSGTSGAYHAGALRALQEAGVKIDIVAGSGMGVATALFAAIDGSAQLSAATSLWRSPAAAHLYPLRRFIKLILACVAVSLLSVVVPLLAVVAGLLVFPLSFLLAMLGLSAGSSASRGVVEWLYNAFEPGALPSVLPRIAVLGLMTAVCALLIGALRAERRPGDGRVPFWWKGLGPLLDAGPAIVEWRTRLWRAIAGGPIGKQPSDAQLSSRYVELLAENLGQPGFREVLLTVHDLEARRDLVFALLAQPASREFFARRDGPGERAAEAFDLSSHARERLLDVMAGSMCLPVATAAWPLEFPVDSYWRGETHRVVGRPESVARLVEEAARAGSAQMIIVSGAPEPPGPHEMREPPPDLRSQVGEYLTSAESAALCDAVRALAPHQSVFVIRPAYNPLGALDFTGRVDRLSHRPWTPAEMLERGCEDAYRQFIEPVVAAGAEPL
jgi:hypothetical protein